MNKNRPLSKSQYTRGLQCPKSLWLYRARPDLRDQASDFQQAIFDQGTSVGELARQWLGGGVLISYGHEQMELALEATKAMIEQGKTVLYEAAFLHEGVLVRADIMSKNPEGAWDLWEVKSTSKLEDTHLDDVAVQKWVIEGAGLVITRAHLVHLDSGYVRKGALDLQKLFRPVDVTQDIQERLETLPQNLGHLRETCTRIEEPAAAIGPRCFKPHPCDFQGYCWAKVPDYSVFDLHMARKEKTAELWNDGIATVDKIPEGYKLTAYQAVQRRAAITKKPQIDLAAIRDYLLQIGYPRTFVDFEAINPAVPPFDGCRPFAALPFEASLHIRRAAGAPLEHHLFLADGTSDPRPDLLDFLKAKVADTGPLIAYHKSYEGGILAALRQLFNSDSMADMEARLWDLADPFKKAWYHDHRQRGSWSIKAVLPVVVPDLSYKALDIQDGAQAMRAYARLMDPKTTPEQREIIKADLTAYNQLDTYAMVKILDRLEQLVGVGVGAA